ncbi:ATP-binding protein [Bradyrhizobium genosp. P]|uniref:ATP-binding protein n=1 Tax=Bradyrhizobium genosp. P TaxID=83641 RepID=UPI003CECE545
MASHHWDDDVRQKIAESIGCLPEAVVIWDENDHLLFWNEKYCELCPVVSDMMHPGVYFPDIVWEGICRNQFIIEGSAENWFSRRLEFHHRCEGYMDQQLANGQWVRMSERRTPWGGVISVRTDLTPVREHEAALRLAKDQAEAATAEKSHFLALISHELRTPMNGVLGLAQALTRTSLTSRQQRYVDTIISSARALAKLLDDILDVSRIEGGQLQVETAAVALQDIFDEIVRLFEPMAEQKRLQLRARLDERLPACVNADPLRLRQILINLVNNALKFTSAGFVELRTRRSIPGRLRIEVADSGPGIAAEHRAALFRPFSQIDSPAVNHLSGAGLGLAISKKLAEAMGGSVGMESGARGGSIFTLDLNVALPRPCRGEQERLLADAPSGLRLLVVDDDKVNLLVAETLLDQMGHVPQTCQSGAEAIEAVGSHVFDAVLLDIAMPAKDGLTVAREIRARGSVAATIPIFAMTAKLTTDSMESYRAAGITGVVPKPIIYEQLQVELAKLAASAVPEQLTRMRADVGTDRCKLILRESCKVVAEARQEANTYRAGGSGKPLAAVLHRLSPTAQMLGLSDLSAEAERIEDRLNQNADPIDTITLSGLLTQSMERMEQWIAGPAIVARPE